MGKFSDSILKSLGRKRGQSDDGSRDLGSCLSEQSVLERTQEEKRAEIVDSARVELAFLLHQPLAVLAEPRVRQLLKGLRSRLETLDLGTVQSERSQEDLAETPRDGVTLMRERTFVHVPPSAAEAQQEIAATIASLAPSQGSEDDSPSPHVAIRASSGVFSGNLHVVLEQLTAQYDALARSAGELPLSVDVLSELVESRLELVKAKAELSRLPCPPSELVENYERLKAEHDQLVMEREGLMRRVETLAVEVGDLKSTVRRIGRLAFEAKIFEE